MALVLRSSVVPRHVGLPVYHLHRNVRSAACCRSCSGNTTRLQICRLNPMPGRRHQSRRSICDARSRTFAPESVGGFVHSHVLEHLPASVDRAIKEMNAALAPGGFHIFQVPIHKGWYREDMDPDMDPSERTRLFHQDDHMRQFGDRDFEERVLELFGDMARVDLTGVLDSETLRQAAVPASALTRHTGHTVYLYTKPEQRPENT